MVVRKTLMKLLGQTGAKKDRNPNVIRHIIKRERRDTYGMGEDN